MNFTKPKLCFWQIINMNVGFFGIQYSFGLQQSAVNPIFDFLGASPDEIPLLNLAGPMTGLLIQPIIGAMSDKTWSPRFGRRKPYFLIGAFICSLCLIAFPYSSSLWMASGCLWVLDAANNTAMEPYRAFVADRLDVTQHASGFQAQSFFTGLGQTILNYSLLFFPLLFIGKTGKIPNWIFASCFLGAIVSIGSVWWSMKTTPEIPPSKEEIAEMKSKPINIFTPFVDVFSAISKMPKIMWLLAFVYMFQWYALFCYWQNSSKAVAQNVYDWKVPNNTPLQDSLIKQYGNFKKGISAYAESNNLDIKQTLNDDMPAADVYSKWKDKIPHLKFGDADINTIADIDNNDRKYEKAVSQTGGINGWYNIVTFLIAFALVGFAKKYSPKYVHFACLILAGIGFIAFSQLHQISLLYVAISGFGIGWASMMGIPYLMVVADIPKEKYGVYMGIINMMIVIPMLIQTVSFGYILKNFLNNDPTKAIFFAGVLLLIAAVATLLLKSKKLSNDMMAAPSTGGH